jgi:hypothetical protein
MLSVLFELADLSATCLFESRKGGWGVDMSRCQSEFGEKLFSGFSYHGV